MNKLLGRRRLPRPGRRAGIVALVLAPIVGAAVGAGTHAEPLVQHQAEATIITNSDGAGINATARQLARARFLSQIIELPQVVAGARVTSGSSRSVNDIIRSTSVPIVRGGGVVRVQVEDPSERVAVALANGLAVEGLDYARQAVNSSRTRGTRVLGDFEESTGQWGVTQSVFNTPPLSATLDTSNARFGSGSLRVVCPATPACGPDLHLYYFFRRGVTYTVEGWVRSDTSAAPLYMVLGSTAKNVAAGAQQKLTTEWKRISVSWTPPRDLGSAEVVFQTGSSRRVTYSIDGVTFFDPVDTPTRALPARSSRAREARALASGRYASLSAARPIATRDTHSATVAWTMGGALAGLAIVVAGFLLGRTAGRRNKA